MYDSTKDTLQHIVEVQHRLTDVILHLAVRATAHDTSKLEPPEKVVYDEFTPKLRGTTYGSDEYAGYLEGMGEALRHHYESNRHHPEHFVDGINGMTLVDLIEMLADWAAAVLRHEDGDLAESLKINVERFGMSEQLAQIFWNTVRGMGWDDYHAKEVE